MCMPNPTTTPSFIFPDAPRSCGAKRSLQMQMMGRVRGGTEASPPEPGSFRPLLSRVGSGALMMSTRSLMPVLPSMPSAWRGGRGLWMG